jgi:hypothetical protein
MESRLFQPVVPKVHAFAGLRRHLQHADAGVDLARVGDAARHIEAQMRQQIDLVEQHQFGRLEHVRVFDRLVLSLGHRQDQHLGAFAQIEQRRADQIADVFDHQHGLGRRVELRQPPRQHVGFEVATGARIDLDRGGAGGANTLGIVQRGLVALDDADRQVGAEVADGAFQQGGFSRAGRTDQIERQDLTARQPAAVAFRDELVLGENLLFQGNRLAVRPRVQRRRVVVAMAVEWPMFVVLVRIAVEMRVAMILLTVIVARAMRMTVHPALRVDMFMFMFMRWM